MQSPYYLILQFRSNERPWSGRHDAYKIKEHADAIDWACYMRDHLPDYIVTLYKGDQIVPLPDETPEES